MKTKTTDSFRNMCRTCMVHLTKAQKEDAVNKKQKITDIPTERLDETILELLQVIQPQIKVAVNDNMPMFICSDCIPKILMAHEFIVMYRNVDKQLRDIFEQAQCSKTDTQIKTDNQIKNVIKDELQIFDVEDNTPVVQEDYIYEATKYEFEIEDELEKEQGNADWLQIEDKTLHDFSDHQADDKEAFVMNPYSDDEVEVDEKESIFTNPYSDASDDEWKPNESSEKKTLIIPRKRIANTTTKNKKYQKKIEITKERLVPEVINEDFTVTCKECEMVFTDDAIWKEHIKMHRRKPDKIQIDPDKIKFKCEECGKGFSKRATYLIHQRVHTGEKPYLCIECGKSFKVLGSLTTHMLRHKGEKTIQCPHCPKKFVCASGLYGHMLVHKKEKTFVCDTCGSAFHMAYQLKKHNLCHNGIKKHQCEYCDMRFVSAEKQRCHMRTHTGEKPYACKYCERAFAQSGDCVKHLKQHLGDNVYQCELCPQRFPLQRGLRVHFATHKNDDEETRLRNLAARTEEEKNLQVKLGSKGT